MAYDSLASQLRKVRAATGQTKTEIARELHENNPARALSTINEYITSFEKAGSHLEDAMREQGIKTIYLKNYVTALKASPKELRQIKASISLHSPDFDWNDYAGPTSADKLKELPLPVRLHLERMIDQAYQEDDQADSKPA